MEVGPKKEWIGRFHLAVLSGALTGTRQDNKPYAGIIRVGINCHSELFSEIAGLLPGLATLDDGGAAVAFQDGNR
jgi:hypothetical protein